MTKVAGKKIFVGLSGGVDSAVTAALLHSAGARVTGVFIKGWYPPELQCTWAADRRDAMRVAAHLHIPFETLDASSEYKKSVIDYLLGEYRAGRTPNPDIMCNRDVKFGAFFEYAHRKGADYLATGHYAVTEEGQLRRGVDPEKDQSYFLWAVKKDAIIQSLFPLGNMRKEETRALAKRFALPVAQKRDSQGICFLGSVSVDDFLRSEFGVQKGYAVDENGRSIGEHDGALLYTLGQRVALRGAPEGPWYVIRKDVETNTITVSHTRTMTTSAEAIPLTQTNWLEDVALHEAVEAQYRYHGPLVRGTLDVATAAFTPAHALPEPVAAGQSLVFYQNDVCVGGGIIVE